MHFDVKLGNAREEVPVQRVTEFSERAESLGFDGLWAPEGTNNPFATLTQAAEATTDIDLLSVLTVAFPRSPMVTAYSAWNLQALSEGRFKLGLGTQVKSHMERRFDVPWESPGPKLRDYVRAIRAIWDAWANREPLDYEGEFYSFDLSPPNWRPDMVEDPDIPIYVGGINGYNIRTAGAVCDGLHLHPLSTPAYIGDTVEEHLEAGAAEADRDPSDVSVTAPVFVITGDDEERADAEERVREKIAFFGSTRTYSDIFETHGYGDVCDELHDLSVNDGWDEMSDLVTEDMLETFAVEAPWSDLRERIIERYADATYVDRVALHRPLSDADGWTCLNAT